MNYSLSGYRPYTNYDIPQLNNSVAAGNLALTGQSDTVSLNSNNQIQDKKEGLSKNAKLGLGALALVGLGTAA